MFMLRKFLIVLAFFFISAVQPYASAGQSTRSAVYLIEKTYGLPNNGSTTAGNVVVTPIQIFDNRLDYAGQRVLSEEIRVDGVLVGPEIYSESRTEDNRIGSFSLGTISPGEIRTITVTQIIRVDHVGPIDPSAVQGGMPGIDPMYTQPIPNLWESDDPVLKNKALELIAGESNPYYQAKAIFDFVENHLTYKKMAVEYSALGAYNSREGDCSEFTHLFSALCRAAGIPTRFVSGYCYDSAAGKAVGHAFAFIYLPGVGWVPMDLTWNRPKGMFGELSNDHLIQLTSDGRNLVEGTKIKIPGDCDKPSYAYPELDPDPNLHVVASESITCLVGVEPKIYAGSKIQDSTWKFSVDVKNVGTQSISNVRVELQADSTYFEVPAAQEVGSIGSGMHQMAYFDLRVKQTVENSFVTAIVTYDSPYGPFRAESQVPVSATIYELPILLLAAMAGAVAAILIVLVKWR